MHPLKYHLTLLFGFLISISCVSTQPLPDRHIETYGQGAAVHFRNGEFGKALRLFKTGCSEAQRLDIVALQARYQFNIGRIYYECNLFDSAAHYFSISRVLFGQIGQEPEASTALLYGSLTDAYRVGKGLDRRGFTAAAKAVAETDPHLVLAASALIELLDGNLDSASAMIGKALEKLGKTGEHFSRGVLYYYLAMAEFSRGNLAKSEASLDSSLSAFRQHPWRYRNWKPLLGKSILAFCRGDSAVGDQYYRRAQHAVPDLVAFPPVEFVKQCPSGW